MLSKKAQILEHIWKYPGGYRKGIASVMGFNPNMVSDTVRELISEGWVAEGQPEAGRTGRAPIPLYFDREKYLVLSVSYEQRGIKFALVNAAGEIIRQTDSTGAPDDPEDLVEAILRTKASLTEGISGRLIGIGVSDPGMVECDSGQIVRSSLFPDWHNVPLGRLLEERTFLTVIVENSSRTRAFAQYRTMPELMQTGASMLYLDYGEGIGFTLVTSDGIWRGLGFAGEIGHVVIERNGRLCGCGARGCLEVLSNTPALEAKAAELLAQGINSIIQCRSNPQAEEIFQAALDGDRMARGLVDEIASHLGLAVAFLVSAFHPKYFVVGAESAAAITCLCSRITAAVHDRTLPEISSSIEILEGREFQSLALSGAAMMVFQEIITTEATVSVCEKTE